MKRKVIKDQGVSSESVIAPSDRGNAEHFLRQARTATELYIEIVIPSIDVQVDKKQLELIYNRFGNDMVLWKPRRKQADAHDVKHKDTVRILKSTQPTYYTCKSGLGKSLINY